MQPLPSLCWACSSRAAEDSRALMHGASLPHARRMPACSLCPCIQRARMALHLGQMVAHACNCATYMSWAGAPCLTRFCAPACSGMLRTAAHASATDMITESYKCQGRKEKNATLHACRPLTAKMRNHLKNALSACHHARRKTALASICGAAHRLSTAQLVSTLCEPEATATHCRFTGLDLTIKWRGHS